MFFFKHFASPNRFWHIRIMPRMQTDLCDVNAILKYRTTVKLHLIHKRQDICWFVLWCLVSSRLYFRSLQRSWHYDNCKHRWYDGFVDGVNLLVMEFFVTRPFRVTLRKEPITMPTKYLLVKIICLIIRFYSLFISKCNAIYKQLLCFKWNIHVNLRSQENRVVNAASLSFNVTFPYRCWFLYNPRDQQLGRTRFYCKDYGSFSLKAKFRDLKRESVLLWRESYRLSISIVKNMF